MKVTLVNVAASGATPARVAEDVSNPEAEAELVRRLQRDGVPLDRLLARRIINEFREGVWLERVGTFGQVLEPHIVEACIEAVLAKHGLGA